MNIFKKIKLFKEYKTQVLENAEFFEKKYALEYNNWYELYTTITLKDAPEDLIKSYGTDSLIQTEVKKYIKNFRTDLQTLNLEEFFNVYEIKKINDYDYGITFGFSLINNRKLILIKIFLYYILPIILGISGILILI